MPDSINVLHVLNSAHGGSALSTFQLIDKLKSDNILSSLVCFNNATSEDEKRIRELVDNRVIFIPLYWTNKRIRVAWWKRPLLEMFTVWQTWWGYKYQRQIDSLIKSHHIQIIHTSTIVTREGAIAARRNMVPHVWHVRELIGPASYYQFPRFKSWVSYVEKHANVFVANSEATAKNLSLYFDSSKIKCIPNAIDVEEYKVKTHHEHKNLIIAMVGNVTSRLKNHEFFIRTAAHFIDKDNIGFRVYGALPKKSDPYYDGLRNIISSSKLENRLTFMGHESNVQTLMSDIDILFHPTGHESFGRIFIEAMAGGIPIVAVDGGGAVELVRNGVNGFRVPENDDLAAAERLNKLISSLELRNTFGLNGRGIVEREYTLSLLTDRIVHLYRTVLECEV